MFFHLQYIHLFRPFLKYTPSASPLPSHVSPRRICTANASAISKLMRLYKKTWNLRQICNIAVYMIHSACTIHLLNLPEKTARRDVIHGIKHLEEISEDWLCARRTLCILSVLARKWKCELPDDAAFVLQRTDEKYGYYSTSDVPSPRSQQTSSSPSLSERGLGSRGPNRDISPLSQYTQAHISQNQQPAPPNVGNQMGMQPSMQRMGAGGMPQPHSQQQQLPLGDPDMDFDASEALGAWAPPQSGAGIPNYPGTFATMNRNNLNREAAPTNSQPNTRQISPGGVNIDSPEWFLTDSARWQQGFEGWEMGGGNPATATGPNGGAPVFMFGDGRNEDVGDGNTRAQAMRSDSEEQIHGFEGLGTSLSGGGWLPGLD